LGVWTTQVSVSLCNFRQTPPYGTERLPSGNHLFNFKNYRFLMLLSFKQLGYKLPRDPQFKLTKKEKKGKKENEK